MMFIPMNVDGGYYFDTNFIDSFKVAVIIILLFVAVAGSAWINSWYTAGIVKLIAYILMFFIIQLIVRYYILEEKYYFRMYNAMKKSSITETDIVWDIASIRDFEDGAVVIFSDMRVGVFIRLERDTITGKDKDFRETHFDAISEFYKEMNNRQYQFVQLSIMEQAGNDPRIDTLDELVLKSDNANLAELIEMQVGYIKILTRSTLYESDYFLIYTEQVSKSDIILEDVNDIATLLMDGAYLGHRVLREKDILDLHKEIYGIRYFDYNRATMRVFSNINTPLEKPFKLRSILMDNGEIIELSQDQINRIQKIASDINNNTLNVGDISIKEALSGYININDKVNVGGEIKIGNHMEEDESTIDNDDDSFADILGFIDEIEKNREALDNEYVDF